jgi:uncharacterized protein (DUF1330 family)
MSHLARGLGAIDLSVSTTLGGMRIDLCVLLWAKSGAELALRDYEDRVLALVADHGGRLLQRARSDGSNGAPTEIQILEFPSRSALNAYMTDERRVALAGDREAAVARTEVIGIDLIEP